MKNINTECIYYGATYTTKSGWKVTLQLPEEDAARALDAIGAGQRYMVALVPIADDEQPDAEAMAKVDKPKRHWNDIPRSQRAGIMSNDPRFLDFMKAGKFKDMPDDPAEFIREWCGVESRADLDFHYIGDDEFLILETEFDAFTGKIPPQNEI